MPTSVHEPSAYRIVLAEAPPAAVIPASQSQVFDDTLAVNALADLEFNIDGMPIADLIVSTDRDLTVRTFVRYGAADIYRQLDPDYLVTATGTTVYRRVLDGRRMPGSQLRIRLINGAVGLATVRAQAHVRST